MDQQLKDAKWVAQTFYLPLQRVYDLTRRAVIPAVRILRQYRYDPQALAEWAKRGGTSLPEENEERLPLGPSLHREDPSDAPLAQRIRREAVERLGRDGGHAARAQRRRERRGLRRRGEELLEADAFHLSPRRSGRR